MSEELRKEIIKLLEDNNKELIDIFTSYLITCLESRLEGENDELLNSLFDIDSKINRKVSEELGPFIGMVVSLRDFVNNLSLSLSGKCIDAFSYPCSDINLLNLLDKISELENSICTLRESYGRAGR